MSRAMLVAQIRVVFVTVFALAAWPAVANASVAPPTVTSISPTSGGAAGGQTLVIHGSGFGSAGSPVTVANAVCAGAVTHVAGFEDTRLQCVSAAGTAGTSVAVVVSNASGTSPAGGVTFSWAAAPKVFQATPSSGPLAGGGTLDISGQGFGDATVAVTDVWGVCVASTITHVVGFEDTRLRCTIAPSPSPKTVDVIVSNVYGLSQVGGLIRFSWQPASCSAGQYINGSSCSVCPAGSFSAGGTATSCTLAPAGSFVPSSGAELRGARAG